MTQQQALNILKTGANVFLTGEPGSGKTHTIREFIQYLREHSIEPAITASTGIAATHIHGQTIHSWSGIGISNYLSDYDLEAMLSKEYLVKRITKAKVLIIDEVSMLSGSTLDMVDKICRTIRNRPEEAFGGLQIILVGDFFQLPPISKGGEQTLFSYSSSAWKSSSFITCYLSEQHRQGDGNLLTLLSAIRNNEVEEMHFDFINSRMIDKDENISNATRLFTKNVSVDALNEDSLNKISGSSETYLMKSTGKTSTVESLKKGCLSPEKLVLKKNSVVMCTKNNPGVGFANGTLGVVTSFANGTHYPIIKTKDGRTILIEPMDWMIEEDGRIRASITQIPLRLAWAITVHKSQGMSLDSAVMDLSDVFEYGQGYVALSRVRSLSGIYLLGLNRKSLEVHPEVLEIDSSFKKESQSAESFFESQDDSKLKIMHENFIKSLGGTLDVVDGRKNNSKSTTYDKTLELFKKGLNIDEIVKERNLSKGTVIDHITSLVDGGYITKEEVLKILPVKLASSISKIHSAFDKKGRDMLSPVFLYLQKKYTYDDIKLARIVY